MNGCIQQSYYRSSLSIKCLWMVPSVHYSSIALSIRNSHYSMLEREVSGFIPSLNELQHGLTSNRPNLYTDHATLKSVFSTRDPHWKIAIIQSNRGMLIQYSLEINKLACARQRSVTIGQAVVDWRKSKIRSGNLQCGTLRGQSDGCR